MSLHKITVILFYVRSMREYDGEVSAVSLNLIPDRVENSIYDLNLEGLYRQGVRLLLADLDNTIARYRQPEPDEALRSWLEAVRQQGMTLFVLSNGRRPARSKRFCESLGVPYISHAGKPHSRNFLAAFQQTGMRPEEAVMLGDQIFTDVWGGHNAGIRAILIRPIALDSLPRKLRYGIETPFRALCQIRGARI